MAFTRYFARGLRWGGAACAGRVQAPRGPRDGRQLGTRFELQVRRPRQRNAAARALDAALHGDAQVTDSMPLDARAVARDRALVRRAALPTSVRVLREVRQLQRSGALASTLPRHNKSNVGNMRKRQ